MNLSEIQKEELIKLLKIKKQYEGIYKTSTHPEQQARIKKDLFKLQQQMETICPDGVPSLQELEASNTSQEEKPVQIEEKEPNQYLSKFPVQKITPNCDNKDVNLIFTVFQIWETEFNNALSESHVKLEFSFANERENLYALLNNLNRESKLLSDTLNGLAKTTSNEVNKQMNEMKERQVRAFLHEGASLLNKMKTFWSHLNTLLIKENVGCMNKEDVLHFNKDFEKNTILVNVKIKDAINIAVEFLEESIKTLNIPIIH